MILERLFSRSSPGRPCREPATRDASAGTVPVLIVPVLNRPELLLEMLRSVDVAVERTVVVDNGDVVWDDWVNETCRVIAPGHNIGVSASWNLGMKATPLAPWWLIVNSDLTFGPGDLSELCASIRPGEPELRLVFNYAAFAVTYPALCRTGYFDENFHPAYDEDLDFERRARLAGVEVSATRFTGTHVGSATIRADERLNQLNGGSHWNNDLYYERKWGGQKQGAERFSTPFGRDVHQGEWRLEPERIRNQAWTRE